ncbi:MAG: hypothetical protein MR006_04155 [Arcanobacterium sp.]|nr:hypothetical protein [Arcanobacterium sp.]
MNIDPGTSALLFIKHQLIKCHQLVKRRAHFYYSLAFSSCAAVISERIRSHSGTRISASTIHRKYSAQSCGNRSFAQHDRDIGQGTLPLELADMRFSSNLSCEYECKSE